MNERLDKAVALLGRVARSIAKLPGELKMDVETGPGTAEITFIANPADTRRLVGRGADNLKQLAVLFRLLARDSGKAVRLCDLLSNGNPEPGFAPFKADPAWDQAAVENLLRDLTEAVFELPCEVRTEVHNEYSVKMYATVMGDLTDNRVLGVYDKAVNVLFVPIGTNAGMKVYAHVQDWIKASSKAAGATAAG